MLVHTIACMALHLARSGDSIPRFWLINILFIQKQFHANTVRTMITQTDTRTVVYE